MVAGRCVDELSADAQSRSRPADASLQHVADVELVPDLPDVDLLSLEAEGRGASGHPSPFDLGKGGDELLGHPAAEWLVVRFCADVDKWQQRDAPGRTAGRAGPARRKDLS